jgi:hypothetical protein
MRCRRRRQRQRPTGRPQAAERRTAQAAAAGVEQAVQVRRAEHAPQRAQRALQPVGRQSAHHPGQLDRHVVAAHALDQAVQQLLAGLARIAPGQGWRVMGLLVGHVLQLLGHQGRQVAVGAGQRGGIGQRCGELLGQLAQRQLLPEIGRASCRERVS